MKLKFLLLTLILGAMAAFSLFGTAGATTKTETVTPSVTVGGTLSLILEDTTNVDWGSRSAGDNPTETIQAKISANADWTLTVERTSDTSINCGLAGADGNHHILSSNFRYTSAAGSPAPSGNGVATATEFGTAGTDVWTEGTTVGECRVAITYNLQIPANQHPQAYSATHTYTLTSP